MLDKFAFFPNIQRYYSIGSVIVNIIDLKDYSVFPLEIHEEFHREIFDLEDFLCMLDGDVSLDARINKGNSHYTMEFHIKALAKARCARCLRDVDINIDKREKVYLFDQSFEKSGGITDLDEKDLDHYYLKDLLFDLEGFANEQIIISLPVKVLCRPDCKGLCPYCGNDMNESECKCLSENIDPRWETLKAESNNMKLKGVK